MNISKQNNFVPKTKDGFKIKTNETLYFINYTNIIKFKVKSWNNGKTTSYKTLTEKYDPDYFISLFGYSDGVGIYPLEETNPFSAFPVSLCFKKFENAQKWLINYYSKIIKKIKREKPVYYRTRYYK